MTITGQTQLIGLLGWPVSHSRSPAMHNAAAAAAGLDWAYVPLPVHPDAVEAAVRGLPALGFRGVNVTIPHKQAVMPFLDAIDPAAEALGAVNTIVFSRNRHHATGYNTDWSGFLTDLRGYGVDPQDRTCLILGAGGSARAVVYALAQAGGRVHLFARRREQAETVARALNAALPDAAVSHHHWEDLDQAAVRWREPIIVNATPLGMTPNVEGTPWDPRRPFPHDAFVYDLVYNPAETKLVRQARAAGCRAENGLGMLVHQGAQAFTLWTGVEPDVAVMRAAILTGSCF